MPRQDSQKRFANKGRTCKKGWSQCAWDKAQVQAATSDCRASRLQLSHGYSKIRLQPERVTNSVCGCSRICKYACKCAKCSTKTIANTAGKSKTWECIPVHIWFHCDCAPSMASLWLHEHIVSMSGTKVLLNYGQGAPTARRPPWRSARWAPWRRRPSSEIETWRVKVGRLSQNGLSQNGLSQNGYGAAQRNRPHKVDFILFSCLWDLEIRGDPTVLGVRRTGWTNSRTNCSRSERRNCVICINIFWCQGADRERPPLRLQWRVREDSFYLVHASNRYKVSEHVVWLCAGGFAFSSASERPQPRHLLKILKDRNIETTNSGWLHHKP